jgi:hypothetical protein
LFNKIVVDETHKKTTGIEPNEYCLSKCLPFIIGVTGHRDISTPDGATITSGLKSDIRISLE